ncbi:hypothetical protein L0Z72_14975 [candidate division KSB1 bacterium]|nr:hypothetical protein [candidate division KSB1 bacterium]
MKTTLKLLSLAGLILTLLPSVLVFLKLIEFNSHLNLMILGTILWFGSAPFWMKKESLNEREQD